MLHIDMCMLQETSCTAFVTSLHTWLQISSRIEVCNKLSEVNKITGVKVRLIES